jgi:type III pantothenate kinase
MSTLLVDIGNTRAKWGLLRDGQLAARGAIAHRGAAARDWPRAMDDLGSDLDRILVSNVAGPGVAHALGEWALGRHGVRAEFLKASANAAGLQNSYAHPESMGVDRWLGMIGAWRRARGPLVCIAAGTAMTVDAVDANGRHAGGLIVAGYEMMIEALMSRTSDIAAGVAVEKPRACGQLGCNTASAIELGACQALAGAAERAVRWFAGQVGADPKVYLGGGDATRLEPLLDLGCELAPDLVLEGLAAMAAGG